MRLQLRSPIAREKYAMAILLLLGFAVRVWGIRQDLPYAYYGDESYLIYHSVKFGTGDLNPHWFTWPTLFQYLLFSFFAVFYLAGRAVGRFGGPADLVYLYIKDPTAFFLIGRFAAALLGTASLYLVYALGKRVYGRHAGLFAASLFTFLPLAVEHSHYAIVDTPMVFMVLLAFMSMFTILSSGRMRDYALSGFVTGLAIGTKYPAAVLVLILFIVHLFASREKGLLKVVFSPMLICCYLCAVAGFFLACPFAILDFTKFLSDMKGQIHYSKIGWFGWEVTRPYFRHLEHLITYMGLPLMMFSAAGLLYAAIRREAADILFLSYVIVFYYLIGLVNSPYPRFMLPLMPFLAIFSGRFFVAIKAAFDQRHKAARIAAYALLIFLMVDPVYATIKTDVDFTLPNTMTLAKEWIERNIPAGSAILMNEYGPPLIESPREIRSTAEEKSKEGSRYRYHEKSDFYYRVKERVAAEQVNYEISHIINPIGYLEGEERYERSARRSFDAIKDYSTTYDYLVLSDALVWKFLTYPRERVPVRYHALRDFYEQMMKEGNPIKVFAPKERVAKGPTIRIYRMRSPPAR